MDVVLGLEMRISCRDLGLLLLHEFHLGHKAMEATSNKCGTIGKDALSFRKTQHCFRPFTNGNFELENLPRTERIVQIGMDLLKQLIEEDPRLTTQCSAERLECSHTAMETRLYELGKM